MRIAISLETYIFYQSPYFGMKKISKFIENLLTISKFSDII
nr:MAG TPA: hypothetical protein [Caudoviricetes sp.]